MYSIRAERAVAIRYWTLTYGLRGAIRRAREDKNATITIEKRRTKRDAARLKETILSASAFIQGRLKRRTFGGHVVII